ALQSKFELPASDSDTDLADGPAEADSTEQSPVEPITEKDLREARKMLPPPELKASPGRQDFNLKADPKHLFEQVARAFGLDVVFDGDYPDGGTPLGVR